MSNELIEKKLNEIINKLLGMSKRIKKLEELDTATVESIEDIYEKIEIIEGQKLGGRIEVVERQINELTDILTTPSATTVPVGEWQPNKKFISWYTGTFADSEDDIVEEEEATPFPPDEVTQAIVDEEPKDIDDEIIKKLDEVNDVIDDA